MQSIAAQIANLSDKDRAAILRGLDDDALEELAHDWRFWGRPEQIAPEGDWQTWLYMAGRGSGKRLSCDTPIPTPDGWKLNGDLVAGDTVFDQAGMPTRVVAAHEPGMPDRMYRVVFSDGSHIDADGEHLWTALTHRFRKQLYRHGGSLAGLGGDWWRHKIPVYQGVRSGGRTDTGGRIRPITCDTDTLVGILRQDTARRDLNLCIPVAQPLCLPDASLPVDPWLYGYWLGNGCRQTLTTGSYKGDFDQEYVLSRMPFDVLSQRVLREGGTGIVSFSVYDWRAPKEKVPDPAYLRASQSQRLALLQGLMDSDGHAFARGAEFCSIDRAMAEYVIELSRSLGQKPVMSEGTATLDGRCIGPKYRVVWKPTIEVFGLPRKARLINRAASQQDRHHHRMITSIDRISPRLSRCITVASPSGLYLAGSGMIPTHNTRAGSEWVREQVKAGCRRIALIAPTAGDARDVMVEGESGLISVCWKGDVTVSGTPMGVPIYEPSKRRVTWQHGAIATLFSADEPERLRGPQHDAMWCDEIAAWRRGQDAWDMAMFGLRIGEMPRAMVTTTPKPIPLVRDMMKDETTVMTRGSTYDNRANLADGFFRNVISKYEGTTLGRQEIHAEILEGIPDAIWPGETINNCRVSELPDMARIVVAVDPAGGGSDSTGIVVVGLGVDGRAYVLDDRSCKLSADGWARRAVDAYREYRADRIVAEKNYGGDMVENTIRTVDPSVPYRGVVAKRGKVVRAEPVAALYEQRRVSHLCRASHLNALRDMEDQMALMGRSGYHGKGSPDRVDALVWAITELMLSDAAQPVQIRRMRF